MLKSIISSVAGNPFTIVRTKPRKYMSRSSMKYSAGETQHELGPVYGTIDVRFGNIKFLLDPIRGNWTTDETKVDQNDVAALEQERSQLEMENEILRTKIDLLLEMFAESKAEEHLRDQAQDDEEKSPADHIDEEEEEEEET